MFTSFLPFTKLIRPIIVLVIAGVCVSVFGSGAQAEVVVSEKGPRTGIIKGVVRDQAGNPIAEATVAVFRSGTSKLLKQVRSAVDGSFMTRLLPGTYSILAVAEGFNPVSMSRIEVNSSAELVYKFNLEPSGKGNTLPEKKAERKSSKYPMRAAQIRRSIYQVHEGESPVDKGAISTGSETAAVATLEPPVGAENDSGRRGQSVVETYFASSDGEQYAGLNFATLLPVSENAEIVLAGQTGTGAAAPNRFEADLSVRPDAKHQVRLKGSIASVAAVANKGTETGSLRQLSFQVLDEWNVSEGIVLVYGFDYSRFIGVGNDYSISPRLGLQFDIDSKTRLRAAYTTSTEERTWQRAVELENAQVFFREPMAVQDIALENEKPVLNKSRRLEFGIERVLDNKSSIEAGLFLDAVNGRGVGLMNLPLDSIGGGDLSEFVANQQGKAQGIRVVYTRRLNGTFTTSAGYSYGNGQKLSDEAITNPSQVFEEGFFQTFVGQLDTEIRNGTSVRTIFRLSPKATVFAIDPFAGRLAIYDPSLSIMVTQSLPNWGLPIRAEAVIDARNVFDFQSGVNGEERVLRLTSPGRILRGGISVRF